MKGRNIMKKTVRKLVLGGAVLALACIVSPSAIQTKAAEVDVKEEQSIEAQVVVPESEVYATVTRSAYNGLVDGDGVRLRRTPSSSGTIVALMYDGEKVLIVPNASTNNWYYLERVKTGVYGFANKKYIISF